MPKTAGGFYPEPTTIKLNFKDSDLDGLVVVMTSLSVDEFNAMMGDRRTGPDAADANTETKKRFADNLVSWNLTDKDGQLLPTTLEEVGKLESNLFLRFVVAWQQGMTTVPTSLQQPSTSGSLPNRSEESILGLGSLSESPGNSPIPA